jgi:GMP reductase
VLDIDGGCSSSGDVAKAFGAGADFVMLGGMMAGHDEGGGEVVDGNVQFYGMSSDTANTKHFGGLNTLEDLRTIEVLKVEL